MRVIVDFQEDSLEFEVADDRVAAYFQGPGGISERDRLSSILRALESPLDFPAVASMLVPGDRVAIALDARMQDAGAAMSALLPILRESVGESGEITVVATPGGISNFPGDFASGSRFVVHDPSDRNQLAYLATTKGGRRVYLNRDLTDADVVIPVGEFRYDPLLGHRGPWSVLFPDLSDEETRKDFDASHAKDPSSPAVRAGTPRIDESLEASWLLGSQFSLGLVPGRSGFSGVIAGLGTSVRDHGIRALEQAWNFEAASRAELVIAGVGRPGVELRLDELIAGITTASGLVQHGGKIVMLSRANGPLGPSLRRLADAGEPRRGAAALRGHEGDADFGMAQRLNVALLWADIYLLSSLDSQAVEDLAMVPLDRADEAKRLAATSRSCIFLSQADLARVSVPDDL